jgi:tryptophanyl-tRNA synthetase
MPLEELKMSDTILSALKKDLGLSPEYTAYDGKIIGDANAAFATLYQLQVGPQSNLFIISTGEEMWDDFSQSEQIKTLSRLYVYFKVRLSFDPPASSFVLQSIEKQIAELEWRLNRAAEAETLGGTYMVGEKDG